MSELKPCPFCGCDDIRILSSLFECEISCENCGALIHRNHRKVGTSIAETKQSAFPAAVMAWNRRADNER